MADNKFATNKYLGPNRALIGTSGGLQLIQSSQASRLEKEKATKDELKLRKIAEEQNFQRHLRLEEPIPQRSQWGFEPEVKDVFTALGPEADKKWMKSWESLTPDQQLSLRNEHKLKGYVDRMSDIRASRQNWGNTYVDDETWTMATHLPKKVKYRIDRRDRKLSNQAIRLHRRMISPEGTD